MQRLRHNSSLKFLNISIPKNATVHLFSLKGVGVSAVLQPILLAGSLAAFLFSHSLFGNLTADKTLTYPEELLVLMLNYQCSPPLNPEMFK